MSKPKITTLIEFFGENIHKPAQRAVINAQHRLSTVESLEESVKILSEYLDGTTNNPDAIRFTNRKLTAGSFDIVLDGNTFNDEQANQLFQNVVKILGVQDPEGIITLGKLDKGSNGYDHTVNIDLEKLAQNLGENVEMTGKQRTNPNKSR